MDRTQRRCWSSAAPAMRVGPGEPRIRRSPPAQSGPRLDFPAGLDTDGSAVYVANSRNNTISRIDLSGAISILAGQLFKQGTNDGTGPSALFNSPDGLTFLDGALYVSDTDNSDIRKIVLATKVVTTIAGTANTAGTENGHGTSAHFNLPTQICSDGKGTLYITDTDNSQIRKLVLADMTVTTIAGQAPDGDGKDDGPAGKSKFNHPRGIATDGKSVFVADTANNVIRKIDLSGNVTSTIAGNGAEGKDNGKGTEASFDHPWPRCLARGGSRSSLLHRLEISEFGCSRQAGLEPRTCPPGHRRHARNHRQKSRNRRRRCCWGSGLLDSVAHKTNLGFARSSV